MVTTTGIVSTTGIKPTTGKFSTRGWLNQAACLKIDVDTTQIYGTVGIGKKNYFVKIRYARKTVLGDYQLVPMTVRLIPA